MNAPSNPPPPGAAAHIPALDGLRGIAVLLVVAFHAIRPLTPWVKGGFIGVDIFFVLSGYLITTLLLREFEQNGRISLPRFYVRRILRLVPALWTLLLCMLTLVWWRDREIFPHVLREAAWSAAYLSNWVQAFNSLEMGYFSHTWSLSIEEQFYLLWPALLVWLVACGGARRALHVALALALAAWFWRCALLWQGAGGRIYHSLDTRFDTPMWGCALAAWLHGRQPFSASTGRTLRFFAAAGTLVLLLSATHWDIGSPAAYTFGSVTVAWLAVLLIADAANNPLSLLRPMLSWRPLTFLGAISYGLYLWHWSLEVFLARQGWILRAPLHPLDVALFITLCCLVASVSFYVVERPFLRLKARFAPPTKNSAGGTP